MGNRMFPKRQWSVVGNVILKPKVIVVMSNIPKLQYDMDFCTQMTEESNRYSANYVV